MTPKEVLRPRASFVDLDPSTWRRLHSRMKGGSVYILASRRNGTLYVGVTSDLPGRMYEHREGLTAGFTRRYGVKTLVWYEHHQRIEDAIQREKNLKRWVRKWKLALIEKANPDWRDLYAEMLVEFGFAAPES